MTNKPSEAGAPLLQWPGQWLVTSERDAPFVALAWVFAAAFAAGGVFLVTSGAALWMGLICVGLAVALATVLIVMCSSLFASRRRGMTGARVVELRAGLGTATAVRSARGALSLFYLFMGLTAVSTALAPVAALTTDSSDLSSRWEYSAYLAPAISIYCLAYLFSVVVRRRRMLGLGLSPEGVYHWSWFGCCFFRWEWITSIRVVKTARWSVGLNIGLEVREPQGRPDNAEESWVSEFDRYRRNCSGISAGMLAVNPALPYYALHFYHRHAELRHELGTEASLDRMRRGDFPDIHEEFRKYGDTTASPGG